MQFANADNGRHDRRTSASILLRAILTFAMIVFFAGHAMAQLDTAAISGTVRDPSGAEIPGATIEIDNQETGLVRTTTTNATGTYQLGEIPPGIYTIKATAQGFSSSLQGNTTLALSQSLTFNFSLKVGTATSTVQVSTSDVNLDTASATLGLTIPAQVVSELPLNGNNYTQALLLMPGVTGVNHDQTGGRTNSVGAVVYPSVNGATNRSNTYYLDGVNNNEAISGAQIITPITADIQQMTTITHADSSQFGGALGGIINVITKSGTNVFHGGAWEYWQSSRFFDASSPITQSLTDLHQNQFGASVGGPVLLPHLYNGRDKTFFYASYEGYRQKTGAIQQALVPTTNQLTGDFSGNLAQGTVVYNPYTGQPFPGNQIPGDLIDQNVVNLIKTLYPVVAPNAPTYNNGTANYESLQPGSHRSDQYDLRGDEYLTQRDQLWVHFLHQNDPIVSQTAVPGLTSITGYVAHNFGAQWTHTFSPRSLLTVGFGQNIGNDEPTTIYSGNVDAINKAAGFAPSISCGMNYPIRASGCTLPQLSATNYIGGGENQGSPNYVSDIWEYTANYQQQIGRHNIFIGFNVDTNNQGKATSAYTAISFTTAPTSNGATGGDALASMLLSLPSGATRLNTQNQEHGGFEQGYYIQDQWKIRDNLTINYGLRYDLTLIPAISNALFGPYYDIFDYYTGTDIIEKLPPPCSATQFAPCIPGGVLPAHVVVSPQPGKFFFPDKKNWEPRFGLSYQIRPDLVFHLGYGRIFDNWAAVDQTAQNTDGWLVKSIDSVANLNQPGTVTTPGTQVTAENPLVGFTGNYPSATPFTGVAGSFNTPPQFTAPHSDQWTVGMQQRVGSQGVWNINYVGSRGRNIDLGLVANTALPGPGPVAPRTQFPYMGQSNWDVPLNKSDYDALQTSLQGRDKMSGLSYIVSYTWSHSIDIGADDWYGSGTSSIEHPHDLRLDRSNSGFDLRNVFTAGWTWAIPVGTGGAFTTGKRGLNYALGNWKLNGIASLASGAPYTITASGDIGNTGNTGTYERANLVGNPSAGNRTRAEWFNIGAFAAPAQYTLGDLGRNTMRQDGNKQFDASLFRNFPFFHDRSTLMLRLDAFNVLNHPIWGTPGNSVTNLTTFGKITSQANSPRQLQISGKITF
jgi:outer membrane receptor protein involved in Fe transport